MTTSSAASQPATAPGRLTGWLRRWQQRLSDRVHAAGDDFARENGWQITPVTGRAGFGGRIYRDPRFSQRRAATAAGPPTAMNTGRGCREEAHDQQRR